MNEKNRPVAAVPESAIREVLEGALGRGIQRIVHRRSDYESSYELENVDAVLADGSVVELIFKNVGPAAILPDARAAKPPFLYHPLREIEMYRSVLDPARHGTAVCHAASVDPEAGRYWLFLQRVAGLKLSYVGEFAIWQDSVRWLATFHGQFRGIAADIAARVPLIVYDAAHYRRWCERAIAFVGRTHPSALPAIERVGEQYDRVIEQLCAIRTTLLHGECYPSNLLVRDDRSRPRICPLDWEMAAVGPGLIDLAALTAGKWTEAQRRALIEAYWSVIASGGGSAWTSIEHLVESLDWCRLHLAVQWLGWSPQWAPPIEQANDWLAEMLALAKRLHLL